MKTAFNSIVHDCNSDSSPTKLIESYNAITWTEGLFCTRDYASFIYMLSLKLVSSSFNVVPLTLDGCPKIKTYSVDGDVATNDSLLDVYAKRALFAKTIPNIMNLSFFFKLLPQGTNL